jgi:exodeoxyribonuclease VII large subunit
MQMSAAHYFEIGASRMDSAAKKLRLLNPKAMLEQFRRRVSELSGRASTAWTHLLQIKNAVLRSAAANLNGLSPLNVLSRGYSITFSAAGGVIRSAGDVSAGEEIRIKLHDGEITGQVTEVRGNGGD